MHAPPSVRTVEGEGLDVVSEWVPRRAGPVSRDDATHPGIWQTLGRQGHRVATVPQTITAGLASKERRRPARHLYGAHRCCWYGPPASRADGIPLALSDERYAAHRFALEVEFNSGPSVRCHYQNLPACAPC